MVITLQFYWFVLWVQWNGGMMDLLHTLTVPKLFLFSLFYIHSSWNFTHQCFYSLFTNHSHSLFTNYSAFLLACIQHDSALSSVHCNTLITHKFIAFARCTLDGFFGAFVGGKFLWIVGFMPMSGDIILWICRFS